MNKGQSTIPIMAVVSAICLWCSGLSVGLYNMYGATNSLTASVSDIKENTTGFQDVKAEVDWLAKQRGYKAEIAESTSTNNK